MIYKSITAASQRGFEDPAIAQIFLQFEFNTKPIKIIQKNQQIGMLSLSLAST